MWQIDYCAKAVTDLNQYELVPFVEPLRLDFLEGKWVSKNTADKLVKLVGVTGELATRHGTPG